MALSPFLKMHMVPATWVYKVCIPRMAAMLLLHVPVMFLVLQICASRLLPLLLEGRVELPMPAACRCTDTIEVYGGCLSFSF